MKHEVVAPCTLIEALKRCFPESSNRTLQNWVKAERIRIDGKPITKPHFLLEKGQEIELGKKEQERYIGGLPLLYEDRSLLIINKPSGLLSVPAENSLPSAQTLLQEQCSVFSVHRIDEGTSGTLLFARNYRARETFRTLFSEHTIKRYYLAIVEGQMAENEGCWESYLRELPNYDVEKTTEELGKLAVTHYQVIRRSKKFTYLALRLETGRKHQIRVHCKEAGHPIVGDKRYGSLINPIERLGLHAHKIEFVHPFTGKPIDVSAPIPFAFKKLGLA